MLKRYLYAILAGITFFNSSISMGVPLSTYQSFVTANPLTSKRGDWVQMLVRGTGTNDMYVLEANPTTGAIPVSISGSFTLGYDTNYGAVGANTLRSAAQIGNATGAANFDYGTVGAQTLRSAAQIGNATGAADFNYGAGGAQTIRTAAMLGVGSTAVSSSNPVPINQIPATSGGLTIHRTLSAASTNATNVKASAGQLYGYYISNINAGARYIKFYNSASAPTCGSGTPVITMMIPGSSTGAGANQSYEQGIAFSSGLGFCLTTGVADNDTGAVAANDIIVNLYYK